MLNNVATVLTELAGVIDPNALASIASLSPAPWAQRLGHLLEQVGAADKTKPPARHVAAIVTETAPLVPGTPMDSAMRDARWRLAVNAEVEADL